MSDRPVQLDSQVIHQARVPFAGFLATAGGETNAIGDYSGGETFYCAANPGEQIAIERLIWIADAGGTGTPSDYVTLPALANGVTLQISELQGQVRSAPFMLHAVPIRSNLGWEVQAGHELILYSDGSGGNAETSIMTVFDFRAQYGRTLVLNGERRVQLEAALADNFSGLINQHFYATGAYLGRTY